MSSSSLNSALASLDRSLVHDFHKIPHIDGHFKNIAPIFNPENSEYDQALLLLALPAVIVGSLIFLGLITYYIARCACAKATPPPITKPPVCVVCWAVILVILSLIMGILCIMGSIRTTNGLNLVDQDLSSLGTFDSGAIAGFGLLQYFSAEGGQNVSTMQAKFGTGAPTNIQEAYLSLQTSFDEISSESSAQVISIEESPFNFNAVVHDINEFNSWREIITLVVFGFFTVVALIAFLSIVCKNDILGLIVCAFGVILIFLAWFLCGVHLSAAVAIADLCAQPNASVSAIVQSWNDKHADSRTALSQSDVNYYLYCDGETPYAPDFDKFSQALLNVHNSSNVLRAYYAGQPEPLYYLDACDVSAANTQLALTQTEETVNCTLTSASFFNALHNACGAPMDSTVLIFICSAFFGLFFLIAQCLFNTLTAYYQKDSKRFWLRGVDPKTQMALLHVEGMPDEPAADESEPPGMYYRRQQDAMDTINGTHTRPVSSTSQRRYVPLPEEDSYRPPTLPEQSQKQQQEQSQEQEQYEQRQGHQQARMQQQQPHYESIYYEPNRNTLASAPPSSSSTYDTHTRAPAPTPSFSADPAAPYATPGQNPFTDPAASYTAPRQNPFTSYPSSSTTTYNTNTSYS